MAEEWTDRFGRPHTSCAECEEAWPCREATVKPKGWLVPGYIEAQRVVEAVAHGFNVRVEDIMGSSARRHIQTARVCAMAVVKQVTGWSFASTGNYFGRHHTSVISAVQKAMTDPVLGAGVTAVVEELQQPAGRLFVLPEVAS